MSITSVAAAVKSPFGLAGVATAVASIAASTWLESGIALALAAPILGFLGAVIGIRAQHVKVTAEANLSEAQAEAMAVSSTADIVFLFRQLAEDQAAAAAVREHSLNARIAELETKVAEMSVLLEEALDAGFRFSKPLNIADHRHRRSTDEKGRSTDDA